MTDDALERALAENRCRSEAMANAMLSSSLGKPVDSTAVDSSALESEREAAPTEAGPQACLQI